MHKEEFRRMRSVKVRVPINTNMDEMDALNPNIREECTGQINGIDYREYRINTREPKRYVYNVTCMNSERTFCHFIVKANCIAKSIELVEEKIDTDVWRITSSAQVLMEDTDIIFSDYPVI